MTHFNKILAALLLLAVLYLGYGFVQFRAEMLEVYVVEDKYAYTPPEADLVIVDFGKFGCEHCRALHPVLMEAIKADGKIRYAPRLVTFERVWPESLATAVYAAAEQGKFIEMQYAIYKNWPVQKQKDLMIIAQSLGLDTKKFSRDLSDSRIVERMREDSKIFLAWRLGKTPSLLLKSETGGESAYQPGEKTPTVEELLEYFQRARGQ